MALFFLIAFNVLFSLAFLLFYTPYAPYFSLNIFFFNGLYWQILSSMFMHADFTHLILNMLVLFQFGFNLEKFLGSLKFVLLYLGGGLLCSLLSAFWLYFEVLYFNGGAIQIVGASGAICVLMGFYAALFKDARAGLVVALILISFVPLFFGVHIAWYAHIFGFCIGYLASKFTFLLPKKEH